MRERRWMGLHAGGAGAVLAVSWAGWALGVEPLMARGEQAAALTVQLQDARRRSSELGGAEAAVGDRLARTRGTIASWRFELLPPTMRNERLAALAEAGDRAGLRVDRFDPKTIERGGRYDTVPIELGGSASQEQIEAFLSALQEHFSDVSVSRLVITDAGEQGLVFEAGLSWHVAQTAQPAQGDRVASGSSPGG